LTKASSYQVANLYDFNRYLVPAVVAVSGVIPTLIEYCLNNSLALHSLATLAQIVLKLPAHPVLLIEYLIEWFGELI